MALTRRIKRPRWAVFLAYVVRRYWRDEALDLASSLAYTSLLSMVPMLAIGLALLAAFPGFESMRRELLEALFRDLVPEVGAQMQVYVGRFTANAGRLQVFGIAGLVATAVMMLVAIEAALNRVFRVPQFRAAWSRLIIYWAALTLGPLLAGVGLTMSTWFSVLPWIRGMHSWAGRAATTELRALVAGVTPFLILTIAFSLLFIVAPNRRVRITDALIGGATAALLVLGLRAGFGLYIAFWSVYRPVYGAVATVPIFLAWVYLSWTAVLFGAEMAAALPELRRGRLEPHGALSQRRRLALALGALAALAEDARNGGSGLSRDALAQAVREGEMPLVDTLQRLMAAGLVERRGRNRFGPADLAKATLADLLQALQLGLNPLDRGVNDGAESSPLMARIDGMIVTAARAEQASLQFPLAKLLDGDRRQIGQSVV
jgi:membrane protein